MSEKRFIFATNEKWFLFDNETEEYMDMEDCKDKLNEQQELIEELQVSDEMGWKRAEHFEKKCPKELHNKKMYIKRLEYKVQKFKEKNDEQQATIDELEKNFDDLVKWASEIAKRNVLLDERIGRLQQAIKRAYEEKPYPTFEDIQAKIKELNDE